MKSLVVILLLVILLLMPGNRFSGPADHWKVPDQATFQSAETIESQPEALNNLFFLKSDRFCIQHSYLTIKPFCLLSPSDRYITSGRVIYLLIQALLI